MTAGEVIRRFDDLHRNSMPLSLKLESIVGLESRIARELGYPEPVKLTEDSPLIAREYGEIYYLYLCSRLDFENGDFERFNNDMAVFAERYGEFAAATVRSRSRGGHMKVGT